jgi:outer membrane protein TolC
MTKPLLRFVPPNTARRRWKAVVEIVAWLFAACVLSTGPATPDEGRPDSHARSTSIAASGARLGFVDDGRQRRGKPLPTAPGQSVAAQPRRSGSRGYLAKRPAIASTPRSNSRAMPASCLTFKQSSEAADSNGESSRDSELALWDGAVRGPERIDLVDLASAWRLVAAANPDVAGAREAVREAVALRQQANAIALPNLNAGLTYHLHNGTLQSSFGQIRRLHQQSLYVGGGSQTLGTQTVAIPAVQFFHHLDDVIYEPLAARQLVAVRRFGSTATANAVLLEATLAYLDLVEAEGRFDAVRATESETLEIARVTRAFAAEGQGRNGDANRAEVEALLVHLDVLRAEERLAVASARLARLLNLEPSVRLRTAAVRIEPLSIVDPSYDLEALIALAVRRHPSLAQRRAAVDAATTRLRREQPRPFLPLVSIGFSAGGFGGRGNFLPNEAPFNHLGNRADFDAMALWSLQNMGMGNVSVIRQQRAVFEQSAAERTRELNDVRAEVATSYGLAASGWRKISVARRQLDDAEDGFRKEMLRLRSTEMEYPIEVLNSVGLLATARQDLILAITAYNRAQFRLFVATGQSPMRAAP